jgi:hypothetical protein
MSRRNKARYERRRAGIAWPIIIFGGILVIAAAFLLLRQGGANETGTPQIIADQQSIDYGYVKFGDTRSFEIAVTNAGDGVLRFAKKPYIEVLEGC